MRSLTIGETVIDDNRTYIIAEAGGNHYSEIELVEKMIQAAAEAGVDAIKFQTFKPENLVTSRSMRPAMDFRSEERLIDVYRRTIRLTEEDYRHIIRLCNEVGIDFLSTPFDFESIELLDRLGISAYKVASGDINNIPFLRAVARKGKPILLSTGASTIEEVAEAVRVIEKEGNKNIALLHCILSYPTRDEDANLRSILFIQERFPEYIVGLSDHSIADRSLTIPTAAIALGARIVEKHFTVLSKDIKECDHRLSADPEDMKTLVNNARIVEKALGVKEKTIFDCELKARRQMRRSLVANRFIRKGDIIDESAVGIKRPADGLSPLYYDRVVGKTALRDIEVDELLTEENVAGMVRN
jgi:sialic acid synthase SpsE